MNFIKLTTYNLEEVQVKRQFLKQLIPFHFNENRSRDALVECLKTNGQEFVYGFEFHGELVGYITYKEHQGVMYITNFLLLEEQLSAKKGLRYWLLSLEKLAKFNNLKLIEVPVVIYNQSLFELFIALGYQGQTGEDGQVILKKKITYHTALVLAGGGARGAYQIGVWRALAELEIPFDIITGTSVGALNGALIMQNDYQVAEEMWQQIDTGKILSYSGNEQADDFSMQQTMKNIQNLVISAINNQGVSTKPLKEMIDNLLDADKISKQSKELFLCTTRLPQLKETVISLKATSPEEFKQWLLASSSFFPAMQATKIGESYYVDGGYRNNIPLDVALANGATEAIIVDVKGPGITKKTAVPAGFPIRKLSSAWNLGTVLLFDGARSEFNIKLGYLETMKSYGHYLGHWYTLDCHFGDVATTEWQKEFQVNILDKAQSENGSRVIDEKEINAILLKIRNLYNDRVTIEHAGVYLLEVVAKQLNVSPVKVYTLPDFIKAIQAKISQNTNMTSEEQDSMLLSVNEWVKHYVDDAVGITEKQQIINMCQLLRSDKTGSLFERVWPVAPKIYLAARLINYLETREEQENESGI